MVMKQLYRIIFLYSLGLKQVYNNVIQIIVRRGCGLIALRIPILKKLFGKKLNASQNKYKKNNSGFFVFLYHNCSD